MKASKEIVIGSVFSALVALSYLGLATGAFVAPDVLGENYGISVSNKSARAYVRATGARDGVLGLLILTFLATKKRESTTAIISLSALVGAADFVIVFTARGPTPKKSLAIHAIGTLGLLGVAGLIRSGA